MRLAALALLSALATACGDERQDDPLGDTCSRLEQCVPDCDRDCRPACPQITVTDRVCRTQRVGGFEQRVCEDRPQRLDDAECLSACRRECRVQCDRLVSAVCE